MIRRLLVVLCCSLMVASCSTYETKIGNKVRDRHGLPPQLGHVYTGIVDAAAATCFVKAPWMKEPKAFYLVPIWVVTILVAAPLALITDTLVLPFDLFTSPKFARTTFSEYCSYHAQDYLRNKQASNPTGGSSRRFDVTFLSNTSLGTAEPGR